MRSVRLVLCAAALVAGCRTVPHNTVGTEPASPPAPSPTPFSKALAHFSQGYMYEHARPARLDEAIGEYEAAIALDPARLDSYYRVAELQYRVGKVTNAIATMREAVRREPTSFDAWMKLAALAQVGGDSDSAGEACRKARDLRPAVGLAYARLAYVYIQQDRLKDALATLDAGRSKAADRDIVLDTYPLLAGIFLSHSNSVDAARCFGALAEARPADVDARQNLIRTQLAAGNRDAAVHELDRLAADTTNHPAGFAVVLADLYTAVGNPARAAAYLEAVSNEHPDDPRTSFRLASAYLDQGNDRKALALLQSVSIRIPENPFLLALIGEVHEKLGERAKALEFYARACEFPDATAGTYIRLALLRLREEGNAAALQTLEEATERFPDDLLPATILAWLYDIAGSHEEAIARFETIERLIASNSPRANRIHDMFYFWYGAACERAGQFDRAVELFRKCIQTQPDNIEARNYLAYMWAEKGMNLEESHAFITRALAAEPDNGAYIDTLAWILYKQKKYRAALRQIRRALEHMPDDPTVTDHLGDILLALNQAKEAVAAWEKSFRLDPENDAVMRKLEAHGIDAHALRKEAKARDAKSAP